MWATFDETNYPEVSVNFEGSLHNKTEYNIFTEKWLELYDKKKEFYYIFNTTKCGSVNISYTFRMASFIKKLKHEPKQYLKFSVIIYKSKWIRFLLKTIFTLQSPVAPVYIIEQKDYTQEMVENIKNNSIPPCASVFVPSN